MSRMTHSQWLWRLGARTDSEGVWLVPVRTASRRPLDCFVLAIREGEKHHLSLSLIGMLKDGSVKVLKTQSKVRFSLAESAIRALSEQAICEPNLAKSGRPGFRIKQSARREIFRSLLDAFLVALKDNSNWISGSSLNLPEGLIISRA